MKALALAAILLLSPLAGLAQSAPPAHDFSAAERMGQRLKAIFDSNDWRSDPNKPAERARYYAQLLPTLTKIGDRTTVSLELANEQLRVGDSPASVATLENLLQEWQTANLNPPAVIQEQLHRELALAYLRLGEQQNCLAMHSPTACLYPLKEGAFHEMKQGATGAIREYTWLLQHAPTSYLYRWLLNLAYQQLHRYPQDVPPQWLLDPKSAESDYDIGYFPNVDQLIGIDSVTRSGGALAEDFSGSGLLDIVVSSTGPLDPMHFFRNNGDGTFTDRTKESGLSAETGGLNMVLTDYNNDGRPDILVTRGAWWGKFGQYPLSLLRNNGDGTFTDVTEAAGLLQDTAHPTQTAAWADYDGDGWLDLFVSHESRPGDPHPCQLFHNNHDGTFTLVPNANLGDLKSNLGFVKGVTWGDYNRDGRPDLYVAAMEGPSFLFRNDGPADPAHPDPLHWKFTDVTESAGLGGFRNSFPTWFFDYDNDGWPDIFAGGYSSSSMEDIGAYMFGQPNHGALPHLFHNNHDGTFTDVSKETRINRALLAMGASFGDLDNDGYLDVYLGTGEPSYESILPNKMFRNNAGHDFQDVTTSGDFGSLQHGHAVAFADFENNGNEDIFEEMGGAYPGDVFWDSMFRNPGHGNHWITLVLEGVQTNRIGYGATIQVNITENGKKRSIYRSVGSVSSFGGNPFRQHIGIGKATIVDEILVHWPVSGITDRLTQVPIDRNYHLREGSAHLDQLHWKTYEFGKTKIAPMRPMSMPGMSDEEMKHMDHTTSTTPK